jgi:hypothetical protein
MQVIECLDLLRVLVRSRRWKVLDTILVSGLTNHRAMGAHNELYFGKYSFKPQTHRPLPFRMEVRVDLIDQLDTRIRHHDASVDRRNNALMSVNFNEISDQFNNHGKCGTETFTHIGERQHQPVWLTDPEAG